MLVDIPIGLFLIISALVGFRDGLIRKLVAIVVMVGALLIGQVFMDDAGDLLIEHLGVNLANAPMYGYLAIFLGASMLQGLAYKIITGGYKIGGLVDRTLGGALGLVQGATFISGLLFILAMANVPGKNATEDSRLYRPVVNLAPQLLDLTATTGPAAIESLKELGTKKVKPATPNAYEKAEKETKEQKRLFEEARKSARRVTDK